MPLPIPVVAARRITWDIAPTDQPWTTQRLLAWTTRRFEEQQLSSPRVRAEMLLAHALSTQRLRLYMEAGRPASAEELTRFRGLVKRALQHEPVDYLVGQAPFFTLTLAVSPSVLVPRPSTEALVEHVLQEVRRTQESARTLRIADVGTGSGAIALALAKHLPTAELVATDLSAAALEVARSNARELGLAERVSFREGFLLDPLAGECFDWLVSNPPYIPDSEWHQVEPGVKNHEPAMALRGGVDGLNLLRPLILNASQVLAPGGRAALELASSHARQAAALAQEAGWENVAVLADHERLPRVLTGQPRTLKPGAAEISQAAEDSGSR